MKYTVLWRQDCENELAALWTAAIDRNAVTAAANAIDRRLQHSPEQQGRVVFDTVRALVIPPLGVEFEVIENDRIVYVLSVWRVS